MSSLQHGSHTTNLNKAAASTQATRMPDLPYPINGDTMTPWQMYDYIFSQPGNNDFSAFLRHEHRVPQGGASPTALIGGTFAADIANRHCQFNPPTVNPLRDPSILYVIQHWATFRDQLINAMIDVTNILNNDDFNEIKLTRNIVDITPARRRATAVLIFTALIHRCTYPGSGTANELNQLSARLNDQQ